MTTADETAKRLWIAELRGPVHGRIETIRGMCMDECSYVEIDRKLSELDEIVYSLQCAIENVPQEPSLKAMELARERFEGA